jgi:glycolate oxidase iron-sulfur subunit
MQRADPKQLPALAGADLCVKCGACLPVCPTYALNQDEADSPRGRIGLMQGLARGALAPTAALALHLDGCTDCRACEPVCPAQVPVQRVVDAGRAALRSAGQPLPWPTRLVLAAARDGWLAQVLVAPLVALQQLGLLAPAAALFGPRWRDLAATLPRLRLGATAASTTARNADARPRLAVGCLAPRLDADTLVAADAALEAIGRPAERVAGCCGALARHAGRPQEADALRAQLLGGGRPLLCSATGCAAELAADGEELTAWLAATRFPAGLDWATEPITVAVHVPCTQRNALRDADASERLLARMPGVRVVARVDRGCCGAAGSQLLGNPAQADALGDAQAGALIDAGAELVVSPNWGCARHLAARAQAAGRALAPIHPVTLLARRLKLRC